MGFYIPWNCNVIVDYQTGVGFRHRVLPYFDYKNSIVIAPNRMIDLWYQNKNATNIHRLRIDFTADSKKFKDIETVFIDFRMPRKESKSFKVLKKLCKGKQIIFIGKPHDLKSLSATAELISVTKNCELKVRTFSKFLFQRGW